LKLFLSRPFIYKQPYKQTWNKEDVYTVKRKKQCSVVQAALSGSVKDTCTAFFKQDHDSEKGKLSGSEYIGCPYRLLKLRQMGTQEVHMKGVLLYLVLCAGTKDRRANCSARWKPGELVCQARVVGSRPGGPINRKLEAN
jgi:hypothetical protein